MPENDNFSQNWGGLQDLDEKLSWEKHIEKICGKVSAGIGAMRRIKPFVPPVTLQTIYKTLVQPYFDYCSPLWDNCGKVLQDKLQKFQNRAARIITGASYDIRPPILRACLYGGELHG